MKRISPIVLFSSSGNANRTILNRARKKKDIIYGARSINQRIGFVGRSTNDFDIFTKKPRKSASIIKNTLNKQMNYNYYYSKPAQHPGTYKVKTLGFDLKRGTEDDESIVDYTKLPKPTPRFNVINGLRYRILKQEVAAKRRLLRSKEYAFRHQKDRDDLNRIYIGNKIWRGRY